METDRNFPFRHAMFCTFQAQHQKSMPCVWLPLKLLRFLLYSGMLWPMCKLDHVDQIGLAVLQQWPHFLWPYLYWLIHVDPQALDMNQLAKLGR